MEALFQLMAWHQNVGDKPLSEQRYSIIRNIEAAMILTGYRVGMFLSSYWMNVNSLSHINYWGMIWYAIAYLHILRNLTVRDKGIIAIYEFAENSMKCIMKMSST